MKKLSEIFLENERTKREIVLMWSLVKKIAEQRGKSAINRRGVRSERKIDAI